MRRDSRKKKDKKKKQQGLLEKEIFSLIEKSMEACLYQALDEIFKDFNGTYNIKL